MNLTKATFQIGIFTALICFTLSIYFVTPLRSEPPSALLPDFDFQEASKHRMFIPQGIVVNTTKQEDLQAAIKLQEMIYRISPMHNHPDDRVPIIDQRFAKIEWGYIHIVWDHFPQTQRKGPYSIGMTQINPDHFNPEKKIVIMGASAGDRAEIENAVSAFTTAAFGIPLSALEDKKFKWPQRKIVAIPENFKTITPNWTVSTNSSTQK